MKNSDFKNNEFEIMQKAWSLYKQFYLGSNADDSAFWDELVKSFSNLMSEYKGNAFCKGLCNLFINDIDERSRKL